MKLSLVVIILLCAINSHNGNLTSNLELSRINHYGADAMVESELVPESIEQGSYIAMAWEDMLPLESSDEKFDTKNVITKMNGEKRSLISQFKDIASRFNRRRSLIAERLGGGNNLYEDNVDKNKPISYTNIYLQ